MTRVTYPCRWRCWVCPGAKTSGSELSTPVNCCCHWHRHVRHIVQRSTGPPGQPKPLLLLPFVTDDKLSYLLFCCLHWKKIILEVTATTEWSGMSMGLWLLQQQLVATWVSEDDSTSNCFYTETVLHAEQRKASPIFNCPVLMTEPFRIRLYIKQFGYLKVNSKWFCHYNVTVKDATYEIRNIRNSKLVCHYSVTAKK